MKKPLMKKTLLNLLMALSITSSAQAADYTLALHKGETFCFVSATEMSNADESVKGRYFNEAFPLATKHGMQNRGGNRGRRSYSSRRNDDREGRDKRPKNHGSKNSGEKNFYGLRSRW